MTWTVLRSAPSCEFRVRDELHGLGLAAYVPVEFAVSTYGKSRETIRRSPLIRGYVFAAIGPDQWPAVAGVREIKGAILIDGAPARLSQNELDAVELLSRPLERGRGVRWRQGDTVQIRRGAFASLAGIVQRVENGKILTEISMLGKLCLVPLNPDQLRAA